MRNSPTANDILALLMTLIGLGIGALCLWGAGRLGTGGAIAGMVIGGIIALPPLLFWNVDKQKWEMTIRSKPTEVPRAGVPKSERKAVSPNERKGK
jgi:hypothetical protein